MKAFAREMAQVRKEAAILFPDVYREVAPTRDTQFRKSTSTVYLAMTQLESIVVEAARGALWQFGWRGDATTDGGRSLGPTSGWAGMERHTGRSV